MPEQHAALTGQAVYRRITSYNVCYTKLLREHLGDRVSDSTLIIGDKDGLGFDSVVDVKLKEEAEKIGNKLFANSIALGLLCNILQLDEQVLFDLMKSQFESKGAEVVA